MNVSVIIKFFLLFSGVRAVYWRQYLNEIPFDAFSIGQDSKTNENIYFGQLYNLKGLLPITIMQNQTEFQAILNEKVIQSPTPYHVEILCIEPLSQQLYAWLPVTSENFLEVTTPHKLIRGGVTGAINDLLIGRATSDGENVYGAVDGYQKPLLYFIKDGAVKTASEFEVLELML